MGIENVIITYRDRPEGSVSKLNTYSDGIKVLTTIMRLFRNYKPIAFFGLFSAICFIAALCLFIPVLIEFGHTGLVRRFPTMIVSGFLGVTALMSWFSGWILESIAQKNRQDFEINLNIMHQLSDQKSSQE